MPSALGLLAIGPSQGLSCRWDLRGCIQKESFPYQPAAFAAENLQSLRGIFDIPHRNQLKSILSICTASHYGANASNKKGKQIFPNSGYAAQAHW